MERGPQRADRDNPSAYSFGPSTDGERPPGSSPVISRSTPASTSRAMRSRPARAEMSSRRASRLAVTRGSRRATAPAACGQERRSPAVRRSGAPLERRGLIRGPEFEPVAPLHPGQPGRHDPAGSEQAGQLARPRRRREPRADRIRRRRAACRIARAGGVTTSPDASPRPGRSTKGFAAAFSARLWIKTGFSHQVAPDRAIID